MENLEPEFIFDLCLCTSGQGYIQDIFTQDLIPVTQNDLYFKLCDCEIAHTSDDFSQITIPEISRASVQKAIKALIHTSESFQTQVLSYLESPRKKGQAAMSSASPQLDILFRQLVDMSRLKRDTIADSLLITHLMHYLSDYTTQCSEKIIWLTLCELALSPKCAFEIQMMPFVLTHPRPSVDEMATALNMSLTMFKNKCDDYLDATPARWLIIQSLNCAYFEVLTTDLSVAQVGIDAGFDNISHFIKLFKREFGMTPLTARKDAKPLLQPNQESSHLAIMHQRVQ